MTRQELSERCKYYRRRAGFKQNDLAALLHVTPSALSKWENGRATWPYDALIRYRELLELSEAEFGELVVLTHEGQPNTAVTTLSSVPVEKWPIMILSPRMITLIRVYTLLIPGRRLSWTGTSIFALSTALIISWLFNSLRQPLAPVWQERFDPIGQSWQEVSARWDDLDGPTARLYENNPQESFGKVESTTVAANIDQYPILRVDTAAVELNASYTIQLLDKLDDRSYDVLKGITYPGEHQVNLGQALGWRGHHTFTINIWINGEGRSATFKPISLEAE